MLTLKHDIEDAMLISESVENLTSHRIESRLRVHLAV